MELLTNTLLFTGIAAVTYYLLSIVQTVLHKDYGHRKRIRAVFYAHAIGHHGAYPVDKLRTEKFIDCESHALNYYGIPIAAFAGFIYFYLGPFVLAANLAGALFTFRWHMYLHEHYHLNETPLERFAWFREKRRLHFIHHADASVNFAVVEMWIDRLLGTRREI